jgi:hypothetical protein
MENPILIGHVDPLAAKYHLLNQFHFRLKAGETEFCKGLVVNRRALFPPVESHASLYMLIWATAT